MADVRPCGKGCQQVLGWAQTQAPSKGIGRSLTTHGSSRRGLCRAVCQVLTLTYSALKDQIISEARHAFWGQLFDVRSKLQLLITLGPLRNIPRSTKKEIWLYTYIGRAKSARTSNRERSSSISHSVYSSLVNMVTVLLFIQGYNARHYAHACIHTHIYIYILLIEVCMKMAEILRFMPTYRLYRFRARYPILTHTCFGTF